MRVRGFVIAGAFLAALAVAAGALGAHVLAGRPPSGGMAWDTGARYHMVHALALVLVGVAGARWPSRLMAAAGWSFIAGIALFSGSIYALALGAPRFLGPLTPVGGLALIAGWILVGIGVMKSR